MQKLVNLLLDFSRIEAGRMEPNFVPADVVSVTEDLISNFRAAIEKAGMKLIFSAEEISEPVLLDIDMWEKIVLNLVSNAFKYTEEGSIEVSIARIGNQVEIAVKDTGVGIPEEEINKVFDRFHRVQNVKGRTQEGTGIGLAMVKELVKIHGGQITVESTFGKGSVFTVKLPVDGQYVSQKNEVALNSKASFSQSSSYVEEALQWIPESNGSNGVSQTENKNINHQYTILLADDNADMRRYVQRLFDSAYNVIVVADGEDAFEQAVKKIAGPDSLRHHDA